MIKSVKTGTHKFRFTVSGHEVERELSDGYYLVNGTRFTCGDKVIADVCPGIPMRGKLLQIVYANDPKTGELATCHCMIDTPVGIWRANPLAMEHS